MGGSVCTADAQSSLFQRNMWKRYVRSCSNPGENNHYLPALCQNTSMQSGALQPLPAHVPRRCSLEGTRAQYTHQASIHVCSADNFGDSWCKGWSTIGRLHEFRASFALLTTYSQLSIPRYPHLRTSTRAERSAATFAISVSSPSLSFISILRTLPFTRSVSSAMKAFSTYRICTRYV